MKDRLNLEYTVLYRPVTSNIGKKLMIPVLVVLVLFTIATLPVSIPMNILLRKLGRKGFFYRDESGRWDSHIGPEAFRRTR